MVMDNDARPVDVPATHVSVVPAAAMFWNLHPHCAVHLMGKNMCGRAPEREEPFMRSTLIKAIGAAALIGVFAVATITPSQAAEGRNAAFAAGVAAGAIGGAAIAGSGYGYSGYGYGPGYAYGGPAYSTGYAYGGPRRHYRRHSRYYYR
jgi:hypothetical protein